MVEKCYGYDENGVMCVLASLTSRREGCTKAVY